MNAEVMALHGFTGLPSAFDALELESHGISIYAPTLVGHGPAPTLDAVSFELEVERLLAQLPSHHQPLHLIGYSMGARVALGLLCHAPQRFASALLIGVHPGLTSQIQREERYAWEARWIDILEQDGVVVFEHHWSQMALFSSQERFPEGRRSQKRTRLCHTAAGLAHAMKVLGLASMPSYWELLRDLRLPVTLLCGNQDRKFVDLAHRFQEKQPNARVVAVPDVGHNVLLEAPDIVSAELFRLLGV